jgi:hypothetical protein
MAYGQAGAGAGRGIERARVFSMLVLSEILDKVPWLRHVPQHFWVQGSAMP